MKAVHKRNLTILALIIFLAVLAIEHKVKSEPSAVAVMQPAAEPETGAYAGMKAPSFTLQEGDKQYVVDGARDKAVILNFWASWCDPCKQEAPELNKLAMKYSNVLDVYGINVTSQDYKPNAERFVKKYMLTFPVMYDLKGQIFDKYNGAVFPTNVLIDKNGVISEIILGVLSAEELEKKIIALTGS
ncbi:TlpA family protein disulfide reductase [Paenibacillus tritici]|uniref:TlpA family protein disulfide reductase n=1 Tax=Paenibacillus tritici TaxID=1873425 RepID=A0ABX2DTN4_9BACL|nr:TlpA disulfide reductase family protein [Paenibacillus tritici]NQX48058.1 TlpA family protein disulfide reductase [Paenibacillus tritici]QUL56995.1 TlpA family protein disulfide reductase [Paenibacillus tritici]